ncbi:MAG TPA: hypothetical protein VNV65_10045 [Candidatus Solibacter sp.]|jgi:hypothetical protein|nr:hypothetical protein [Candidatus Solibacter sp.]
MSEALGLGLVLGMLGIIAMRTIGPVKAVPKGKELMVVQARFIDRLLLHRFQLISLLAILALGSGGVGTRWIAHPTFLVAVGATVVLLLVPFRYLITTEGVNTHTSLVKDWSEFRTYQVEGRRVVLRGDGWTRRASLYMSDNNRKDLERVLRSRGLRPAGDGAEISTRKKASARR